MPTVKVKVKLKKGGALSSKEKSFAALAPPKNKITFADKLAGAKKSPKMKTGGCAKCGKSIKK